ncbi:MAG: IS256 family transposase [Deltaproteobacteria bacterium]
MRPELLDELLKGVSTQEDMFGPDGLLKRLTGRLVERALKAELALHLAQGRESSQAEANRSNGTSRKTLLAENGQVPIAVARDRDGTFEPLLVPKHSRRIKGFDDKVLALYARGLSVRDIQGHLEELYGTEVSPELISRVTEAVRDEIVAWQSRPIERVYAVIWLDALFVKVRDGGVVQNKAAYVAIGLRLDGGKELLGLWIEATEGSKFRQRVLGELQARGLQDVLIACCDGLKGLPQAIGAVFPQTVVQTCIVHQVRYSLSFVSWKDRRPVVAGLRKIYASPTEEGALAALDEFAAAWADRYPMIAESWRRNWEQIRPFLELPPALRKIVYTTNAIESLNYQLRKVIKTKGHFPSDEAAIKLLFLALRNVERRWHGKAPPHWKQIYAQLLVRFGERAELRD